MPDTFSQPPSRCHSATLHYLVLHNDEDRERERESRVLSDGLFQGCNVFWATASAFWNAEPAFCCCRGRDLAECKHRIDSWYQQDMDSVSARCTACVAAQGIDPELRTESIPFFLCNRAIGTQCIKFANQLGILGISQVCCGKRMERLVQHQLESMQRCNSVEPTNNNDNTLVTSQPTINALLGFTTYSFNTFGCTRYSGQSTASWR
jgi:hypothetical protein